MYNAVLTFSPLIIIIIPATDKKITVARKGHYNIFFLLKLSRDNFNLSRDKFKLSRDNFELSRDN